MIKDQNWCSKLRHDTDKDQNTPLHIAAREGNLAAVQMLLEQVFQSRDEKYHLRHDDMRLRNKDGKNPTHMAAERGHAQ